MPAAAIPIIMYASSAAATAYGIYSQNKQQNALQARYDQQRQSQQDQMGRQNRTADQILGTAMPGVRRAAGYYTTLLNGDRGAMRNATAAPRASINETYSGAERGLVRAGLRGGARDQAMGDLSRERAGKVAGLTTGVQPAAAEGLGNLSAGLLGAGNAAQGQAGLTGANLLNSDASNMWQERAAGSQSASGWGSLLASILSTYGGSGRSSTRVATGTNGGGIFAPGGLPGSF